ncbi:MAG: hypothetical protein ACPGLY_02015 [Rubripirellula sp.]
MFPGIFTNWENIPRIDAIWTAESELVSTQSLKVYPAGDAFLSILGREIEQKGSLSILKSSEFVVLKDSTVLVGWQRAALNGLNGKSVSV